MHFLLDFLRNRVISAVPVEGIAAEEPFQCQESSFQRAILFNGLDPVSGASRNKYAVAVSFIRGDVFLVKTDRPDHEFLDHKPLRFFDAGLLFPGGGGGLLLINGKPFH